MLTTSERASSSSLVTSVAPISEARAAVRFWLQAITSISNARPIFATREPSPPRPTTPSVLPFRPSPQADLPAALAGRAIFGGDTTAEGADQAPRDLRPRVWEPRRGSDPDLAL